MIMLRLCMDAELPRPHRDAAYDGDTLTPLDVMAFSLVIPTFPGQLVS